jgi:DNA-binding CsgD family transcriptional regulator
MKSLRSLKLSGRELQIVRGVFDDYTELAIAKNLNISPHTIHTHCERLYHKLAVTDRVKLVSLKTACVASWEKDTGENQFPSPRNGVKGNSYHFVLLVIASLFTAPAFAQFVEFSSYSSSATPMNWNTPNGPVGVNFSVSATPGGVYIVGGGFSAFSGAFLPPDNPAFTTAFPLSSYQDLLLTANYDAASAAVDYFYYAAYTIVLTYSQPVNFASDVILFDVGGRAQAGAQIWDGPFTGTFSASLNGVPVSTSNWGFNAFDVITPIDPVSFSWNSPTGQFQVDHYFNSIAGILSTESAFDTLTLTYNTYWWDMFSVAQYASPVPDESSTLALLAGGLGVLSFLMRRGRGTAA